MAAGIRQAGSPEDFYNALAEAGKAARIRHNGENTPPIATTTYMREWLPNEDDRQRYQAEAALRVTQRLREQVRQLVRASLLDGAEHTATIAGAHLGILVRAEDGHETYVSVTITGSFHPRAVAVVLNQIPGCDASWGPESSMPTRGLRRNEQVWSNIMDPVAASAFLSLADES